MTPKVLFVYDMESDLEAVWEDGLWAALQLLKRRVDLTMYNIHGVSLPNFNIKKGVQFILGWGAFGSPVDRALQAFIQAGAKQKVGLCIGGNAHPPVGSELYDVLFYETNWYKKFIGNHPYSLHAFGVNTDIYKPDTVSRYAESYPVWNYLTVGAFANWKRQDLLCKKTGRRMAIGQIQKGNIQESIDIVGNLLLGGVAVSDMVHPRDLARYYYMADIVYIPADINGGGERAVLEARACDRRVEIEPDNPKLAELTLSPIWDHSYYSHQLYEGITRCLK